MRFNHKVEGDSGPNDPPRVICDFETMFLSFLSPK